MDSSCREAEATSSLRHSGSGRPVSPPLLKRQGGRPSASILTTPPPSPLEGLPSVALPTPFQTAMHCLWPPCRDPPHPPPRGGLRQPPHVFSPIPPPPERRPSAALPTAFKTARDAAVGRTPRLLTTTLPGRRPSAAPHIFSPLPPSAPRGAAFGRPPPPLLKQPGYPTSLPPPASTAGA